MKKKAGLVASVVLAVGMLVGCSSKEEKESFVITYVPQESSEEKAKLDKAFEQQLEEILDVDVTSYHANSYNAAVEAMKNDKADLALFGAFSYIVAAERADAEVIAAINMAATEEQPISVFVVPAKSTMATTADIKGKTIGFADPVSTSGHLMPKSYLMNELNVSLEDLETDGKFFKSAQFAGGHDKAIIGMINEQYDVAAVSPIILKKLVKSGMLEADSYKIIGEVPNLAVGSGGAYAIRGNHSDELKAKVKDFLLHGVEESYVKNIGGDDAIIIDATDKDFDGFRKVAEDLKLSPEQLLKQ